MYKNYTSFNCRYRVPRSGKEAHPIMSKRSLWVASILAAAFLLVPTVVTAGSMDQRGTSSAMIGSNLVTWDSNFSNKGYEVGTPMTMKVDWSGTERVAGLVSMGLATQFSPGKAEGQIIGIQRLGTDAALVTVRFTRLHKGQSGVANAFLNMNLAVDDGTGRIVIRPFPVKCHVNSN